MGHAPSPSERVTLDDADDIPAHLHGSGAGVGSGAGDGRTSSPEQMLKWRLYEMSDESTIFRAPLGASSPHDGRDGSRPHLGHHEVVPMSTKGGSSNVNDDMPHGDYDDWTGQGGDHRLFFGEAPTQEPVQEQE